MSDSVTMKSISAQNTTAVASNAITQPSNAVSNQDTKIEKKKETPEERYKRLLDNEIKNSLKEIVDWMLLEHDGKDKKFTFNEIKNNLDKFIDFMQKSEFSAIKIAENKVTDIQKILNDCKINNKNIDKCEFISNDTKTTLTINNREFSVGLKNCAAKVQNNTSSAQSEQNTSNKALIAAFEDTKLQIKYSIECPETNKKIYQYADKTCYISKKEEVIPYYRIANGISEGLSSTFNFLDRKYKLINKYVIDIENNQDLIRQDNKDAISDKGYELLTAGNKTFEFSNFEAIKSAVDLSVKF